MTFPCRLPNDGSQYDMNGDGGGDDDDENHQADTPSRSSQDMMAPSVPRPSLMDHLLEHALEA